MTEHEKSELRAAVQAMDSTMFYKVRAVVLDAQHEAASIAALFCRQLFPAIEGLREAHIIFESERLRRMNIAKEAIREQKN